jgi:hypothetical protein
MTTVAERVKTLMEHYNLSVYRFTARVGEERAEKFYNILKGKMRPNFDTIQSISNGLPEVNIDWLVMGRGEMLLIQIPDADSNEPEIIEELTPPTPNFVTRTEMLEQQIADRDKMIEMLQGEVAFLRGIVQK